MRTVSVGVDCILICINVSDKDIFSCKLSRQEFYTHILHKIRYLSEYIASFLFFPELTKEKISIHLFCAKS